MDRVASYRQKKAIDRNLVFTGLLGLVLGLGVALRFYNLGAESFWMDEVTMMLVAQGSTAWILEIAQGGAGRPPVFVLLLHFWIQVFGSSEVAARALTAVIGSISLVVMYILGREMFGRWVGLLGAFLFAISEFQIYHAQNVRYYGVFVLLALLSYLFLYLALKRGRPIFFVPYVLASVFLFFAHSYGAFVLASQGLYFLLQWRKYRGLRLAWVASQASILLATGYGLLVSYGKTVEGAPDVMQWIPQVQIWFPLRTVFKFVFPGRQLPGLETVAVGIAFFVLGMLLFVLWRGREGWLASLRALPGTVSEVSSSKPSELLLVSMWLVFPIALPFMLSLMYGSMYIDRYTITASPALYLLLALGIVSVHRVVPGYLTAGLIAILIAPGLYEFYATPVKEQWRETAALIETNADERDAILFAPAEGGGLRRAFTWYYQGSLPMCDVLVQPGGDQAMAETLRDCTVGSDRFWLVVRGYPERVRPYTEFFLDENRADARLLQEQKFTDITVYLLELTGQQSALP